MQQVTLLSLGAQHVDFAQLVKMYTATQEETRYSPVERIGAKRVTIYGNPNMDEVSRSHVEHHNLSTRTQSRRYTRLASASSRAVFRWVYLVGARLVPARMARSAMTPHRLRRSGQPQGLPLQSNANENRSKKWDKHHAALALWFAYSNFCRLH
jgi:hypothetical protein